MIAEDAATDEKQVKPISTRRQLLFPLAETESMECGEEAQVGCMSSDAAVYFGEQLGNDPQMPFPLAIPQTRGSSRHPCHNSDRPSSIQRR